VRGQLACGDDCRSKAMVMMPPAARRCQAPKLGYRPEKEHALQVDALEGAVQGAIRTSWRSSARSIRLMRKAPGRRRTCGALDRPDQCSGLHAEIEHNPENVTAPGAIWRRYFSPRNGPRRAIPLLEEAGGATTSRPSWPLAGQGARRGRSRRRSPAAPGRKPPNEIRRSSTARPPGRRAALYQLGERPRPRRVRPLPGDQLLVVGTGAVLVPAGSRRRVGAKRAAREALETLPRWPRFSSPGGALVVSAARLMTVGLA